MEGMRCAYSSFFGWLYREGLIRKNPVNNISTIKYEKTVKEPFTAAEMEKLKFACKKQLDLTIVNFLRCTGCRIGEMEKLNRNDVDLTNKTCIVRGKGKKQRRVYIDEITAELLTDYLKSRTDDSPALFIPVLETGFRHILFSQCCGIWGSVRASKMFIRTGSDIPAQHILIQSG